MLKEDIIKNMYSQLSDFLTRLEILDDQEVRFCLSLFRPIGLRKDEFFLSEEMVCGQIAFVCKGALRAFSTLPDGEENITCFKFENQLVTSFESFMFYKPSLKSIQAIEKCHLLSISRQNYQDILKTIPSWQSVINVMLEQEYSEKERYLIHYSNQSAKEKYVHILEHSPEIVRRVKVEHLASYLGITQRTLTRIRKELSNPSF
ncbi:MULTISPECIES: Crp/Fnr family transcriptional regulator [Chryseobacterium]|uniref:CRP-like cAMP-binding protein n=1 Tax=Chryseobacterium camelliae TaxID=1265445 RepID=A0ABU0TI69_9FLAO|nr:MULTISPECIES: Crp/Fnr family transcriptional regulator [Chryseobacterium]MDT3409383.1 CRP-like cAMP-binding protein [Pseudacidovorax intermedius]MDQ1096752.1 CRP-like cAMP-binding protein [Chryseobacterium camelliae]MDQ1100695.1 CRP-like cAMP-binding protein [Chryseobacterium sp. SORGH_AS_1048]MDR6088034.1 CRP-like cAMP-binding protein [Chryseobacterium sp. SORGH_AS_0909]MDR6132408.1 CRP-like cAMP-binding protein [Chryseobacterium sp. SORGH_AS_1175]